MDIEQTCHENGEIMHVSKHKYKYIHLTVSQYRFVLRNCASIIPSSSLFDGMCRDNEEPRKSAVSIEKKCYERSLSAIFINASC